MPSVLTAEPVSGMAALLTEARAAGLMRTQPAFYRRELAVGLLLSGVTLTLLMQLSGPPRGLAAFVLGLVLVRFFFLGHDAAHGQIAASSRANRWLASMLFGAGTGISASWWRARHDQHHAFTNIDGRDPDLVMPPFCSTECQVMAASRPRRWFARRQLYGLPLVALGGLAAYAGSIVVAGRRQPAECGLLLAHHALLTAFYIAAAGPWEGLLLTALTRMSFTIYVTLTNATAHKGMVILDPEHALPFLEAQTRTTRNVRGGALTDWLFGGLNYQLEHHLFPRMPRNNLRLAQPIVRAELGRQGLPYSETTPARAYGDVLTRLREVAATPTG